MAMSEIGNLQCSMWNCLQMSETRGYDKWSMLIILLIIIFPQHMGGTHRIDHWYTGIPHFQTEPVAESTAPQDPKLMMLPGGPPMNYSSYISTYLENLPGIYISKANLGINLGMGCIFCFETSNRCFWWFLKPWLWSQHISAVEPIAFAIENGHL